MMWADRRKTNKVGRKPNKGDTVRLTFSTAPRIQRYIDAVVSTELYGRTRSDVIDRLIGDGIRQLIRDGVIAQDQERS